jgi:hypothetical protein
MAHVFSMDFIRFLSVSLKQAEPRASPRVMAFELFGFIPDYWQGEALEGFPHRLRIATLRFRTSEVYF